LAPFFLFTGKVHVSNYNDKIISNSIKGDKLSFPLLQGEIDEKGHEK